ncbi:MAG: hypothetical protein AAB511_03220 [Patescibacteria group bacterium]
MNIIAPIILIIASVGLFFGYIDPTYTKITGSVEPAGKSIMELQAEEQNYINALTKTADIDRVRTGLASQFTALDRGGVEKLEKLLPDNIDTVRLIIDINNRAAKYGMSPSNITLSVPGALSASSNRNSSTAATAMTVGPDDSLYGSVKLSFNVTGSYDNFLRFLQELEVSLRIVDITSLSFKAYTPPASATSEVVADEYTYSMTIRTYYLK